MADNRIFGFVFAVFLVVAAMFFNIGCNSRPSPKPVALFTGFVYVGEAPFSQAEISEMHAPPHGQVEMHPPTQLSAGTQYIFHHHRPLDDEEFALKTLPEAFRSVSLHVTAAPKSPGELLAPFSGGPFFTIQFEDGDYTAYVFNVPCPELITADKDSGPWVAEDYVLAIPSRH
jgi:hypothetical protein